MVVSGSAAERCPPTAFLPIAAYLTVPTEPKDHPVSAVHRIARRRAEPQHREQLESASASRTWRPQSGGNVAPFQPDLSLRPPSCLVSAPIMMLLAYTDPCSSDWHCNYCG